MMVVLLSRATLLINASVALTNGKLVVIQYLNLSKWQILSPISEDDLLCSRAMFESIHLVLM